MDNLIIRGYLDIIEVLGILFMLIYHSTTYQYSIIKNESFLHYVRYFLRTILSTCVPLFFFANGYLLLNRSFSLKKHINKSVKMVVLTFLWGAIMILLLMPVEKEQLSIVEFIKYLWNWHHGWINHLWYMGALICIYVFFPLLKIAFDKERNIFIFFLTIAFLMTFGNTLINYAGSAFLFLIGKGKTVYRINWFNIFNPFSGIRGYAFVYFCVGGLAHEYRDRFLNVPARKRNIIAVCSIIISCGLLFGLGIVFSANTGTMWDVVWDGYDTLPTLVNVLAIFVLSLSIKCRKNILIRLISTNTLGIYFVHVFFIHLLRPHIKTIPFFCTFGGSTAFAIIILLYSLLITLLLRKTPILKKLVTI